MLLAALGALIPAGEPDPLEGLQALGDLGFHLASSEVTRCGLSAHHLSVELTSGAEHAGHGHRQWSDIDELLAGADLPERATTGARRTFRLLGEVEAEQHAVPIDEVHFHEVGAVDALVDIVGVWLLIDSLSPETITVGPVGLGHGTVKAAHGVLPLPAPATTRLLRGHPVRSLDVEGETCTPTGAALLVSLADAWGPLPSGTLGRSTRGAGTWNPADHPNVVTVIEVANVAATNGGAAVESATVLSCNVDDRTGEDLGRTIDRLLAEGASDAWIVPIVMKKSRPAHEVRVLCEPARADHLRSVLLAETGALGCRTQTADKHVLPRRMEAVELDGWTIRVKIGPHGAKPEYDDLVAMSDATGEPIRLLRTRALQTWSDASLPEM